MRSLDKGCVEYWRRPYVEDDKSIGGKEQELFTRVGPRVAKRGYYQKAEVAMVGDWKSPRIRNRLARNPDADVRDISRLAFAAPERLQHRILSLLHAVRDPVASALLTVWAPDRHTVIDFGAFQAFANVHNIVCLTQDLPPP